MSCTMRLPSQSCSLPGHTTNTLTHTMPHDHHHGFNEVCSIASKRNHATKFRNCSAMLITETPAIGDAFTGHSRYAGRRYGPIAQGNVHQLPLSIIARPFGPMFTHYDNFCATLTRVNGFNTINYCGASTACRNWMRFFGPVTKIGPPRGVVWGLGVEVAA